MKERNLLFGLLAVRNKKVPLDELASMAEQTVQMQHDLGSLLVAAGTISEEDRKALETSVDQTIQQHGGLEPALKAVNADPDSLHALGQSLFGDASHAETLVGRAMLDPSNAGTVMTADAGARSHMDTINTGDRSQMDTVNTGDRSAMETISTAPTMGERSQMDTIASQDGASDAGTIPMQRNPADSVTLVGLHGKPGSRPRSDMPVPAVSEHPGRYQQIKVFRSGGMGQITLVHDKHLGRDIALKTLLPDRVPGGTKTRTRTGAPTMDLLTVPIIARFLQEAHVTGQLEHPSIIPIYELGYREDGTIYYTMKFVRGLSIEEKLKEAKDLRDRLLLLTHFLNICQAIAYAHSRGVIHRDIKPMNMMVGEFGETVVIDWGIAKVKGEVDIHESGLRETVKVMQVGDTQATAKTMYGQTIGSPFYMPPEQAAGKTDEVDERADIYSLGALLYIILTGKPPYHGMNVREFLVKVQQFDPKPVLEVEPQAPKELAAIVAKAMARKREDRYQTASELASEIEKFISGGLVSAYEYSMAEIVRRWVKRNRTWLVPAAAGLVAVIALGIWSYFAIREQRDEAVRQEGIAKENEAKAREELYFANVNLAQNAMGDRLPDKARTQLAEAPPEYNNWEWGFMQREANADRMTLKAGGQNVGYGDGIVVAAADFGKTDVYDTATGELLHTLFEQKAGSGYAFGFSAASGRVALLGMDGVHVWDAKSGTEVYRYEEEISPARAAGLGERQLSLSADGKLLAMLNADKSVRVINVDSQAEVFTTAVEQFNGARVQLSADASKLFVVKPVFGAEGFERQFEVIDLATGSALGSGVVKDPYFINSVAMTADGGMLAMGMADYISVWSGAPMQETQTIRGPRFILPNTLAFSPDGGIVVGGTDDGDVGAWSTATGEYAYAAKAHNDKVRHVLMDPSGTRFYTASGDRTIKLWELTPGETPKIRLAHTFLGHDEAVFGIALSPAADGLASTAFKYRTKLWDLKAEMPFYQPPALAFHAGREWAAAPVGKAVALWDARTDYRIATLAGHTDDVNNVAFSPDGAHLASLDVIAEGEDVARVWSLPDGAAVGSVKLPKNVTQFAPLNGGQRLLASQQGTLRRVDVATGESDVEQAIAGEFVVDAAGARAAFAAPAEEKGRYAINVMNLDSGAVTALTTLASADAPRLAWSGSGNLLAASQWEKPEPDANTLNVHLLPASGGEGTVIATGFGNRITALAFNADESLLAVGGSSGEIELYELAGKTLGGALRDGHSSNVTSLDFSPDGSRLASASFDGTFLLWDPAAGRQVLTAHNGALNAPGQAISPDQVRFNAKGDLLATITDGTLVPPFVLKTFPWDAEAYPAGETMQDRVEAYKRGGRR
ncbi:MAG: hypothetical protein RLZZ303_1090 [Candidatus Hydrogenedentota bacterium]